MSETKIQTNLEATVDHLKEAGTTLALGLMAVATIIGMTEISDHREIRALTTMQPAYAFAGGGSLQPTQDNTIRKEKEEVAHRPISYGITMRSEAVSGKR
jgi:hypothetical protein